MQIYIITGLAGAGKSTVLNTFEDQGFYCIDNIPPSLLIEFLKLHDQTGDTQNIAAVMDLRLGTFFKDVLTAIKTIREFGYNLKIIFVEATDEVLIRRFNVARRSHPLQKGREIKEAIEKEKKALEEIRKEADLIIDTSGLNIYQLRKKIGDHFISESGRFEVVITSFGIKYGMMEGVDYLFDLRFLPNPFYEPHLKDKTGYSKDVREYVMSAEYAEVFLTSLVNIIEIAAKNYEAAGRERLDVGVYCTGGRHRSITIAILLKERLEERGLTVSTRDRDVK